MNETTTDFPATDVNPLTVDAVKEEAASIFDEGESVFTEDDFTIPERLVFVANTPVKALILEANKIAGKKAILLNVQIKDGEHEGKQFTTWQQHPTPNASGTVNAGAKARFVQFCLAFFSKDELVKGTDDWTKYVARVISFIPAAPRTYSGKTYQDLGSFELLPEGSEVTTDSIPF